MELSTRLRFDPDGGVMAGLYVAYKKFPGGIMGLPRTRRKGMIARGKRKIRRHAGCLGKENRADVAVVNVADRLRCGINQFHTLPRSRLNGQKKNSFAGMVTGCAGKTNSPPGRFN